MPGMTSALLPEEDREDQASMRPRLNAGDDRTSWSWARVNLLRFNEAPAKCRG